MEHLAPALSEASDISSMEQAVTFATSKGIDLKGHPDSLMRIQRVAAAEKSNPGLVNPNRPTQIRQ